MADLTDFFGSGGGGGLTPKFQEFNSSGTFTPSASLIAAGGYIEVFLVAGGGRSSSTDHGFAGGEVIIKKMYLTSVSSCSVTIGAGGASNGAGGGNSIFSGSSAGGTDVVSSGGNSQQINNLGAGWPGGGPYTSPLAAGSGTMGYGAGGSSSLPYGGVRVGKPNSGQGSSANNVAGSGYCLIKWYE